MISNPLSVSELNEQIKALLEAHYQSIWVKGEVSRVTYHSSGHIYFSLKDKNSTISCVMFRSYNKSLKFQLEEGMSVILLANISLYVPRGSYQLNVAVIELEGAGALSVAFEQLKKKLEKKGYFDIEKKKPLPPFPKKIALVTSKTGAALQDMLRVAQKRYPLVKFILIDTQVQGEDAHIGIAKNIKVADTLGADLIIVARGGGSMEDLWSFNEEVVADAIYEAKTPIISAIGHEIDYLISDFVADKRASTPSNAIEIALKDKNELLMGLDYELDNLYETVKNILAHKRKEAEHLVELFKLQTIDRKINNIKDEINLTNRSFDESIKYIFMKKRNLLNALIEGYKQNDPKLKDKNGFAQILKNGKVVNLEELKVDDEFELQNFTTKLKAKILNKD